MRIILLALVVLCGTKADRTYNYFGTRGQHVVNVQEQEGISTLCLSSYGHSSKGSIICRSQNGPIFSFEAIPTGVIFLRRDTRAIQKLDSGQALVGISGVKQALIVEMSTYLRGDFRSFLLTTYQQLFACDKGIAAFPQYVGVDAVLFNAAPSPPLIAQPRINIAYHSFNSLNTKRRFGGSTPPQKVIKGPSGNGVPCSTDMRGPPTPLARTKSTEAGSKDPGEGYIMPHGNHGRGTGEFKLSPSGEDDSNFHSSSLDAQQILNRLDDETVRILSADGEDPAPKKSLTEIAASKNEDMSFSSSPVKPVTTGDVSQPLEPAKMTPEMEEIFDFLTNP